MEGIVDYEESEPYLEAKQYMERLKEENDEVHIQRINDPCDLAEHSFSLTVYPITVPCAPLSYATVQWDIPETPVDPPSTGSVNDVDFSAVSEFDWTFNLSSTDSPYQESIVDFLPEAEQQPDVTLLNTFVSSQELDLQTNMGSSVEMTVEDCGASVTSSTSPENSESSESAQVFMDTQESSDLKEISLGQERLQSPEEMQMKPPQILDVPDLTLTHQDSLNSSAEMKTEWTEKSTTESNGEPHVGIDVQEEITLTDQMKTPDEPVEQEETDFLTDLHQSDQSQDSIITDRTNQVPCNSAELEPMEAIKTSVTVIEMNLNDALKHAEDTEGAQGSDQTQYAEEPVSSVETQLPEGIQETENRPTKPSEMAETEAPEKISRSEKHLSDEPEQITCPDKEESSEQMICSDEEKPEPLEIKLLDPTEETQHSDETGHLGVQNGSPLQESALQRNGSVKVLDRAEAQRLAESLYRLDGFKHTDVVRHLDKDTEFSRAVGEEYLKYFDFTDQSLEQALRSFLKEVVLIGETQERERVLQHFSSRFQQCNPDTFSSAGAVLTLTCAVMLLNSDLHGQNVGKPMSLAEFVSNLEGMNAGENFNKDCLKSLYNSIKSDPLRWAIEDDVLAKSMMLDQDSEQDGPLRSKSNPFQDLPHNKKATVFQKGFLKRKAHADIDGKRTPWGKRSWKTFYAVLKGMVLYLQKDEYQMDWQSSEEVVSVHHALAEQALNYTKRPHVFRLQTADWRVFLFEANSIELMNSWIGRINLVSALYSSPPFPAAVGSQKKFCRPILPASHSNLTLDKQLQSHAAMLESFERDLSAVQQGPPDGRKTKARDSEELRQREEYLQYEKSRYEVYLKMLEAWQPLETSQTSDGDKSTMGDRLNMFDEGLWRGETVEADGVMKRSLSSPSLELEAPPQPVVKVRRNISERRTYRKIVIPRRNKEL
ncbi:uncharacterized protein [Paramisgurnus dabryanus]|uniref:uncharacterized protein n=1 Tax=Paramisgurnus dabryanus TaxID=90735 RepID=UPI0031F4463B